MSKVSMSGEIVGRQVARFSWLVGPAIGAVLGLSGCDSRESVVLDAKSKVDNDRKLVEVSFDRRRGAFTNKTSEVHNVKLTFPAGDYRVALFELTLSKAEGVDSLTGGKELWRQEFHIATSGEVVPLHLPECKATQSILVISGRNGLELNSQQIIILNAAEPVETLKD